MEVYVGNDIDALASMIGYKLDIKGPTVSVQTFCSTSLVAVHLACQSLMTYECDLAIAGGVSIEIPQGKGYIYHEGSTFSSDGVCRALDAQANGMVAGNGLGAVVVKRIEDALQDGDNIYAVIRGSAVNNDGIMKASYTAPGMKGQVAVISQALGNAEVEAKSISYIETHGTGTPLGDSIELAALTKVFQQETDDKGFCAIGSLKPNIGHLNRASGIMSLIKTALALKHKQLPPSLNFEQANPELDLENSPFYVNSKLSKWESNEPRRAGVSSFGIGGVNAHLILEETPEVQKSSDSRPYQLLLLSAKTETALELVTSNLLTHLRENPNLNLADVAYTLQLGRSYFNHRRMFICRDVPDAIIALQDAKRINTPPIDDTETECICLLNTMGQQWLAEEQINWSDFYQNEHRQRLSLPTYPFERQRYWVEATNSIEFQNTVESTVHPRPEITTPYIAPTNETEQQIAEIWQNVLGIEKVGIQDNFFELDGNSLTSTQVVSRLRQIFNINLSLTILFEAPTIEEVAVAVEMAIIDEIEKLTDKENET